MTVSPLATVREALEFYATVENWTQVTSWGGRIFDEESAVIHDYGKRAAAALAVLDSLDGTITDLTEALRISVGFWIATPEEMLAAGLPTNVAEKVRIVQAALLTARIEESERR